MSNLSTIIKVLMITLQNMIYLVTWDLNKEKPNYASARANFLARLDQYPNIKDSGLDSVRFLSTTWTAEQVYDDLKVKLDGNDKIIVVSLSGASYYGYLNKGVWEFIDSYK